MIQFNGDLNNQHYLPTRFYTELPRIAKEFNVKLIDVLSDTGLSEQQLLEAGDEFAQLITQIQSEKLLKNLLRLANDPYLAFSMGEKFHFSSHGVIGFAALASPNVGAALEVATKYFPVLTSLFEMVGPYTLEQPVLRKKVGEKKPSSVIEIRPVAPMLPEVERFIMEAILANMLVMAKYLLGEGFFNFSVELSYPLEHRHQNYAVKHNFSIIGEQKRNCIILPSDVLDTPLPLADALSLKKTLVECDILLEKTQHKRLTLAKRIRERLRQENNGFIGQDAVARELNISSRALHRLLTKEGTSFREMANEVRVERAKVLLLDKQFSISQVAHQLGYSDAANFTRAFRKLEGMSPSEYRDSELE